MNVIADPILSRQCVAFNFKGPTSSLSGRMERVRGAAHCVSKAGIDLLTKVLAMELAPHRINVNAVSPGLIEVPAQHDEATLSLAYRESYARMIPSGRMGETHEIARARGVRSQQLHPSLVRKDAPEMDAGNHHAVLPAQHSRCGIEMRRVAGLAIEDDQMAQPVQAGAEILRHRDQCRRAQAHAAGRRAEELRIAEWQHGCHDRARTLRQTASDVSSAIAAAGATTSAVAPTW